MDYSRPAWTPVFTGGDSPACPPHAPTAPASPGTAQQIRNTHECRSNGTWVLGTKIVNDKAVAEGLKCKKVTGDGSCQPRALVRVLLSMNKTNFRDFKSLKAGAAGYLKMLSQRESDSLKEQIEIDLAKNNPDPGCIFSLRDDWKVECLKHFEGADWGNEITIRVYAKMLKANIQLWDAEDGHKLPLIKGTVTRAMRRNTTVTINLWYRKDKSVPIYNHRLEKIGVSDGHYNAMIRVGNCLASVPARR